MSYSIQGQLFSTRDEAINELVALWVSNSGEESDMDEIKSAINDDAADDIQDSIDDLEKFLNHITGIKNEWQDMLGRGVIPMFEIELTDGEYLNVDLGIVGNGIYFTFDQDGLPEYFGGDIISVGDDVYGVYVLPFDEYMTLQDMLELIADNIREGFIAPNSLFDSRDD